ncbi:hypothetical protein NDU88_003438 [Pleurodeles waltl]|uniref:Uncharacterized protein n=1 Tax=Pleurodeles waltl TaxID=8319 RepID=A0AAV7PEN0_PLEWA|nr:hypothetical protein NDU88_003438 [Pleurodeles waltl]
MWTPQSTAHLRVMPLRNPCRPGAALLTCGRAVGRASTPLRPGLLSLRSALFIHGPGPRLKPPRRVSQPASGLNVYADPSSPSPTPGWSRGGGREGLSARRRRSQSATGRISRGPSPAMRCSALCSSGAACRSRPLRVLRPVSKHTQAAAAPRNPAPSARLHLPSAISEAGSLGIPVCDVRAEKFRHHNCPFPGRQQSLRRQSVAPMGLDEHRAYLGPLRSAVRTQRGKVSGRCGHSACAPRLEGGHRQEGEHVVEEAITLGRGAACCNMPLLPTPSYPFIVAINPFKES